MLLSWDTFNPKTRWIIRSALGGIESESVSIDSLRSITRLAILGVRGVGPKRGLLAVNELERVIERHSTRWGAVTLPEELPILDRIPPLPASITACDLVRVEDLGQSAARVIEKLFAGLNLASEDRVSLRWLMTLEQDVLESIKGLGCLRATRFIKHIADYNEARAQPSASALALSKALENAPCGPLSTLDDVRVNPASLPIQFRKMYARVTARRSANPGFLQWVLTASAVNLCQDGGIDGIEADMFVRHRDEFFAHDLIARAIQINSPPQIVKVAVHLRIAMHSDVLWGPETWEREAGVTISEQRSMFQDFLRTNNSLLSTDERAFLESNMMAQELRGGATLAMVGAKWGLSRERVRQRVFKLGHEANVLRTTKRNREAFIDQRTRRVAEFFIRRYPGCTPSEVSVSTGLPIESAVRECKRLDWLTLSCSEYIQSESATSKRSRSTEQIVRAIQDAATLAYPITKSDYDRLKFEGFIKGPSSSRILQVFGSWQQACDEAGVESGRRSVCAGSRRRWLRTEVLRIVLQYLRDPRFRGQSGSYRRWKESCTESAELPHLGTIMNYLGRSWSRIRMQALQLARQSWDTNPGIELSPPSNP